MRTRFSIILIGFTCTLFGQTIDLSGEWTIKSQTPRGERQTTMNITQTSHGVVGKTSKTDVHLLVEDQNISWSQPMSTPMGSMTVKYQGVFNEESMEGTFSMDSGPMAGQSMTWSAMKKIPEPPKEEKKKKRKRKKKEGER